MQKIFILSIFITFLFAQNPRVYSALGDNIYNNVDAIENLKSLSEYPSDKQKINKYVREVRANKVLGFNIESSNKKISPAIYLKKLREFDKINKSFVKKVELNFEKSLKDKNTILFSQMINSQLLNTKAKQKEIMDFYIKHQEDINPVGVIQGFLDDDAELRRRQAYWLAAKKREEAARVKHIRAKDKAEDEARNKRLTKELMQKKKEIREYQKRELNIN